MNNLPVFLGDRNQRVFLWLTLPFGEKYPPWVILYC